MPSAALEIFKPSAVRDDAAINFGYSSSAWWLRVDLAAEANAARDWLLDVAFPTLDSVEYFGPGGEHLAWPATACPFTRGRCCIATSCSRCILLESGVGSAWLRIVSEGT
jgi:hypothetical protein